MLVGQPQLDAAGRRSSLISAPEAQRGAQPASQPDFSPPTPGHGAAQASFQASLLFTSSQAHLVGPVSEQEWSSLRAGQILIASMYLAVLITGLTSILRCREAGCPVHRALT